jgi:hypothetical protein
MCFIQAAQQQRLNAERLLLAVCAAVMISAAAAASARMFFPMLKQNPVLVSAYDWHAVCIFLWHDSQSLQMDATCGVACCSTHVDSCVRLLFDRTLGALLDFSFVCPYRNDLGVGCIQLMSAANLMALPLFVGVHLVC